MERENAIEVKNISKVFRIYPDKGKTIKERLIFSKRRRYEERHVLNGISFNVKKGEAIGLIGHNGCGKSTTLKLLTKIMYPDTGTIEMRGRVSSLIELGAGFHPDMSGRENIYINASIFGLTKKEIEKRIDEIIEFSELQEFIDNPVRTYSSGMYMRLAFAVAINVDADILLIDEILAVGDAAFQAKCFNKLREIKAKGTTIVIVSHSLSQIEQICDRSIWIHEGKIRLEGLPRIVDPKYMAYMSQKVEGIAGKEREEKSVEITENATETQKDSDEESNNAEKESVIENDKRWGSKEVVIDHVNVTDSNNKERYTFSNSESFCVNIYYKAKCKIEDAVIGVAIYRDDQTYIYGTNSLIDSSKSVQLNEEGIVRLVIKKFPVNAGKYSFDLAFHRPDGFNYDFWREVFEIQITNEKAEVGIISLPHCWDISRG